MFILCEKPSVARDFASALGASPRNGFFEGNGYTVTYCVGHLFELLDPEDYDPKFKKWSLEALPIIPEAFKYRMSPGTAEQARLVLDLLRKNTGDALVATDAGREGELIARIVLVMACVPNTGVFRRYWVSEALTPDIIRKGIQDAKPLAEYDGLSRQAFARQRADWLVGMNMSRLASIGNPPPPWSVGRVQTAVLSAIGARNEEVKNFVAVPYKELQAQVGPGNQALGIFALLENPKIEKTAFFKGDDEYLAAALNYCKGKPVDSVDAKAEEKRKKPERLLNITGLQKLAFKRHGYKPEETLNIAQALYETHKCLSYPRTPSRVMGDNNVDLFREKFELLKDGSSLSSFCDPSLIDAGNRHIFNSAKLEDHHALIPLDRLPESASEKERNVYNIVLESFFTVCMGDFVFNEKSLRFHVGDYVFASRIREVIQYGWKESRPKKSSKKEDDDDDDDVAEVKGFDEDNCRVNELCVLEKLTQPKKEFALDTLLAFMEHPRGEGEARLAGLGTPATRADIIKKLFAAEYVREEKKKLYATERGRFLLSMLSKNDQLKKLTDVSNTTDWEERLSRDPEAFEREIKEYVALCVKSGTGSATFQRPSLGACPLCRRPVYETKLGYGCSGYKEDPKCNFVIWKTISGATVSTNDAQLLLIGQKTKVKKCRSKTTGKEFEAAFALKGAEVEFIFKK
jgi:DNA topoisomerase-3